MSNDCGLVDSGQNPPHLFLMLLPTRKQGSPSPKTKKQVRQKLQVEHYSVTTLKQSHASSRRPFD